MRLQPIPHGGKVTLRDGDASGPPDAPDKGELKETLAELTKELDRLQSALHAEAARAVLVVLQGRDGAGKDGAIRGVFGPLDPQGVSVTAFKVPTAEELAHDFLWRIHRMVPPKGTIGVFNRSHYEDVLVVRVDGLVPESAWRPRYEQINQFERSLVENGTTVLKFLLHISREEQRERLLARLEDEAKYWKFDDGDLRKRTQWDAYTAAYEEAVARTSTDWAPWYVVPADRKPLRDVLIAKVLVETLERLAPKYPGPPRDIARYRAALAAG
ncbi:MAG TPA: PPK2 family polyphosphate kinase [Gemmatimonadales bacterium]|nr:PPK2 family polyphosphate kinase [Gemmatimonadales bacterium]